MLEFWIAGNKGSGDRKRNGKRLRKASDANCWIGGVKCRETWRWRRWRLVARHAASRWCEPSFLWLSSFIEVQTFKLRIPMLISSLMPAWCWSLGHAFTLSLLQMTQFPEESLNLSSTEGFGYFPGYPGQKLNKGQYEITWKVGFGSRSSTWLVLDSQCVVCLWRE